MTCSSTTDCVADPNHQKVQKFLETIEYFSESDFQKNFRMEKTTADIFLR